MDNGIQLLVKDIPRTDYDLFLKQTEAHASVISNVKKIVVDYSWVDTVEEAIPYLDNIIRNPRRFITQEEDIIPIEKTKKVSEEAIKHLAIHTGLIQSVDEDGSVKPIKLLNVFKEETIDLYENRFVYSLINNLYVFVMNQLDLKHEEESNTESKLVAFEGKTKFSEELINIKLEMETQKDDATEEKAKKKEILNQRLAALSEVLADFKASLFMKAMVNATPVRSPIRKTNIILKDQNFVVATQLWEFLERYQIEKPLIKVNEKKDISSKEFLEGFNLTYFLSYCVLNEKVTTEGIDTKNISYDVLKLMKEYINKFSVDEQDIKKKFEDIVEDVTKNKQEVLKDIFKHYDDFIENHQSRLNRAVILLK